jgi:hypothetical protein
MQSRLCIFNELKDFSVIKNTVAIRQFAPETTIRLIGGRIRALLRHSPNWKPISHRHLLDSAADNRRERACCKNSPTSAHKFVFVRLRGVAVSKSPSGGSRAVELRVLCGDDAF